MSTATVVSAALRWYRVEQFLRRDRAEFGKGWRKPIIARIARRTLGCILLAGCAGVAVPAAVADTPLTGVTAIATGDAHTCAVTSGGGVRCWGSNQFGQLGDGTTTQRLSPLPVSGLTAGVTGIAAGRDHTCALKAGGVQCWGMNMGQLGDGTTERRRTPVAVIGLSSEVIAIAAGSTHTCAVLSSGGVQCWGENHYGQLGDGSTTDRLVPTSVTGLSSGVTAIAAGDTHTCVLNVDGGVQCWGWNWYGQLGEGTTTDHPTPTAVPSLGSGVAAISAGGATSCAVTDTGEAKCWGYNRNGQLGNGTRNWDPNPVPVPVSGLSFGATAIAAGLYHACAITTGGGLRCWGWNGYGELGDGTTTDRLVPVPIPGLSSGAAAIATGTYHTCALTIAGDVQCWGDNANGQLGDGTSHPRPAPVDVSGLASGVTAIYAGGDRTCAIAGGGNAECWGLNTWGQMFGPQFDASLTPAVVAELGSGVTAMAAGYMHACAVTATGGVKCWGSNHQGQLGADLPPPGSSLTPVDVIGLDTGATAVAAGWGHSCAAVAGDVKCWGSNQFGQLGDGGNHYSHTPVQVTGLPPGMVAVTAGEYHTCALSTSGQVWCWGQNWNGQLGDGTQDDHPTPVAVGALTPPVQAIAAGAHYVCALNGVGTIQCWGSNANGQLGDGSTTQRLSPSPGVDLGGAAVAIAADGAHTCALLATGAVKCWGRNGSGELGDGTFTQRLAPVTVAGLPAAATQVAAGNSHTCARTADGAAMCWGSNLYGQLGNGEAGFSSTPRTAVLVVYATTTAVSSSTNPSQYGQSVTLTATVSSAGAVPTETVTFRDGAGVVTGCDSVALTGGTAECMTSALGGGGRSITATYSGDANNRPSTSAAFTQNVTKAWTYTQITGRSPNPVTVGSAITVAATVQFMTVGVPTPTGTVTVSDGTATCTFTLPATSCALVATTIGTKTLRASYGGNANFDGSLSGGVNYTVNSAATALTSSFNPSYFGQGITFTAIASGIGGTVGFNDGATAIPDCGSVALDTGQAECTTTALGVGSHSITAAYSGDGVNPGSTSTVLVHDVSRAATATTITGYVPNPAPAGSPVTVNVTVSVTHPGAGTPTGTVNVTDGSASCTFILPGTSCALTPADAGTLTLTARYGGDGNFEGSTSPVIAPEPPDMPLAGIAAIAAGYDHTCALTNAGSVRCWGNNGSGQLGNGTTSASSRPVVVSGLSSGVLAITAGAGYTCALAADHGVQCWGSNDYGQLGDGTTDTRLTPVPVDGLGTGVAAISAGRAHTCAATGNGVKCWGDNRGGQLGNYTPSWDPNPVPVPVVGLTAGVTAIAAGGNHTCALTSDGALKCWGYNNQGQLGDSSTSNRPTPVTVSGLSSGVTSIAAGFAHTCALTAAGSIQCWGDNSSGQLGDGTITRRPTPVVVFGLDGGATAIAAGYAHTCAVSDADGVQCWGSNSTGQLGLRGPAGSVNPSLTPIAVSGLSFAVANIAAGKSHTCALTNAAAVQCWGDNLFGQLGDGAPMNMSLTPTVLGSLGTGATALAAGDTHTCVLTANGDVKCWGENGWGQLGNGTWTTSERRPVDVAGLGAGVTAITAGFVHTCAITSGGGVKCWGSNDFGQLGDGTTNPSPTPVANATLTTGVTAIAAGYNHTCAVTAGGGVQCWGDNYAGQLGNGTTDPSLTPVPVSGLSSGVVAIATGFDHTCALTGAGGVQCWGFWDTLEPIPIDGLSPGVAALAKGLGMPCAVTASGGVKCWYASEPPRADADWESGIAAVAEGGEHVCALTATGGVQCKGTNDRGQLGDGTTSNRATPVAVSDLSAGGAAIAAGRMHTCALTTTGSVRCWGDNAYSQLGDGAGWSAAPVAVVATGSTTVLSAPPNRSYFGHSVTFTATVSGVGGTPTGTVAFKDGAGVLADCASVSMNPGGQAQCTTSALGIGRHSIAAVYSGDVNNGRSTSATRTHYVYGTTTTSITAHTPNPVTLGSAITVVVSVSAAPGAGTPTGMVGVWMWSEEDDSEPVQCEISLPATSCVLTPASVGNWWLVANYTGHEYFEESGTAPVSHTVTLASSTTTAVESSANPSYFGQNVTLTATVTGTSPGGAVEFKDGLKTIVGCDARPMTSAKATCTTNALTLGWHAITAVYTGDPANLGSTSPALDLEIIPADPPPTVMSLELADPSPTMADAVRYTLKFSEPVTGLTALNFTITPTKITSPSIGNISGSGDTWTITVNTGRHTGQLRLGLTDATGIKDGAGNAPANLPFFGEPYEIDKGGAVLGTGQGRPDSTFGNNGYALFNLQQGVASPGAVAVLASGRILAAGGIGCDPATGSNCTLQLAQYQANGVPDGGFGSSGRIPTTIAGIDPDLGALIVNGDGTFFVAGSRATGGAKVPFVAKFASNGNAAGSYGTGGVALLSSLPLGSAITGAAVDDAGRVLVVGTKASAAPQGMDLFVARLTTAGKLDGGFGSGGVASFGVSASGARDDLGTDIAVQPNGRIVVGGRTLGADGFDFLLLRLNANGAPDKPFGNAGIVTSRFEGATGDNLGRKLALQADGRIVLAGAVATSGGNQCGIARFDDEGVPDESFGTHGQVLIPLTQGCLGVTLQPDGKLVVVAQERYVDVTYATYARMLADGKPDTAFGTDGVLDISSYGPATKVAVTTAGKLVSGLVIENPGDGIRTSYVVQLGSELAQATTTKITSIAPSPALTGQPYVVAVTVTAGTGTPTGSVFVTDGEGASCTISLPAAAAGSGSCTLTSTTKGNKTVGASYGGASDYRPSVGTRDQRIDAADTATTLEVSPNPALAGETVTLTARVTTASPGATTPAGAVTFKDARTTLGTAPVVAGIATLDVPLAAATYDVTASFDAADPDYFRNSKSSTIKVQVQPLPTLKFSVKDLTVSQKVGSVKLTVQRVGSTLRSATAGYATKDGSAKAPTDYTETTGTLTWAAGETSRTISVPIVNRGGHPADRKFTVSLSAPVRATLGTPAAVTITIHN